MVDIVEIKGKIKNGSTIPYIVRCSDEKIYVVKFPGNIQGKKALVNEFVASKLCEYLKLPIFNYNLIKVKKEDYMKTMELDMELLEGTAFGTVYNENAFTILNAGMISRTINRNDAVKVLIFDLLIGNYDRNKGNLMIDSVTKKLYMIDHSHIFGIGTIWDSYQLPRLTNEMFDVEKLHPFNYFNIVNSFKIDDEFQVELYEFVQRVKSIKRVEIEKIIKEIPNDWDLSSKEKQLLVEYIYERFHRVEEILIILNLKVGDCYEKQS